MFMMAVGHSDDPDTSEAVAELVEQCQAQLQGHQPQAGVLFAALDCEHQALLDGILSIYPDLELVGCTTAGEISSTLGYQQDSICLNLFYSDEVSFHASVGRDLSKNPIEITLQAYQDLLDSSDVEPKLCLVFPQAITTVSCAVVEAMATLPRDVTVVGGIAGGDLQTLGSYQFFRNEVHTDSIPMLMMGGNLNVSSGYASGWYPMGKTGKVTKVEGNIIIEIDHEPALNFYEHYFSTFSPDNAYPLAVFPPGEDDYLLRAVVENDPEKGHLYVGGSLPENSTVQITSADKDHIIEATQTSFSNALRDYPGDSPDAALFFTCAWRYWVLGTQTHQEFEVLRKQPELTFPCSGFYTFGEIAPLRPGTPTFSHNTTFITLLMGTR